MSKRLKTLLESYKVFNGDSLKYELLNDCSIYLESATFKQIVFYRNHNNERSIMSFKKRLDNRSPGLLVLISKPKEKIKHPFIVCSEEDFLLLQKNVLEILFPLRSRPLIAAITGTNGKTTTGYVLMQLLNQLGLSVVFAGTNGLFLNGKKVKHEFGTTSPSFIDLWKIHFNYNDCFAIIVEASSHGLSQGRFYNFEFKTSAFTNISRDHLDYHKTFEEYFQAKNMIFKYLASDGNCFVLEDQKVIQEKTSDTRLMVVNVLKEETNNIFFDVSYNIGNLSLAVAMANALTNKKNKFSYGSILAPEGRLELFRVAKDKLAIVDFAHTPDAVENVISEVKRAFDGFKVRVIFGCGGNRDKLKRELMGEVVSGLSDSFIITNDNPRDEDPLAIIEDIKKGIIKGTAFRIEMDREMAIESELDVLEQKEILLILGKGHENYQVEKGIKRFFSDQDVIKKWIQNAT